MERRRWLLGIVILAMTGLAMANTQQTEAVIHYTYTVPWFALWINHDAERYYDEKVYYLDNERTFRIPDNHKWKATYTHPYMDITLSDSSSRGLLSFNFKKTTGGSISWWAFDEYGYYNYGPDTFEASSGWYYTTGYFKVQQYFLLHFPGSHQSGDWAEMEAYASGQLIINLALADPP